ncbi:F-box only protein 39-like [Elysia marginata]|uniref:F-box only protein 39-like n=1 Tax=Elysia marginata TaxID=1093978 RepID=A0AAV4GRV0_9GAST|nr:F-box only protein 39-like [Elysia marginata]
MWPKRNSSGPHTDLQQVNWGRLPYVALLEIFRCLSNTDKLNASLACRAWQLPFHEPMLWRRGRFRFNGVIEMRALYFACRMGSALRHITIDCSVGSGPVPQATKRSAKNLSTFLSFLVDSGNAQLSTFRLTHLDRFRRQWGEPDYDALRLLLAAQQGLVWLDLENAGLWPDTGFQILGLVGNSSGSKVQKLHIADFMLLEVNDDDDDIDEDPRVFSVLASFTALTELSISYDVLSDELLFLLGSTVTSTLSQISVVANCKVTQESQTSSRAWTHLCLKCPRLSASFQLKGVSRVQSVLVVLTPKTPLARLQLSTPGMYNNVNLALCLDHIVTNFHGYLQSLELNLHMVSLNAEGDLTRLVQQFPDLENLHVTSTRLNRRQELGVHRALRRTVTRQPGSRLKDVTLNGQKVSLETTWTSTLVDWLTEQL